MAEEKVETFVAICPNYWGQGTTKEKAIKNAVRAGGRRQAAEYSVWRIEAKPEDISIDGIDGTIYSPTGCIKEKIQTSTLAQTPRMVKDADRP